MDLLLYLALVPTLGVTAQWLAWRTRLPGILLLLLFGVVLGLWVQPDQYLAQVTGGELSSSAKILFPLVSLSVAVIMFEGGLSLKLGELREAGGAAFRLVTVGALVTWVLTTVAAHYILGFHWRISLLLGAILIVTGPTVIGPLLRQVRPSRRVASTLKWEGIVIDPVGAILAVLVFEEVLSHSSNLSLQSAVWTLSETVLVGVVLGVGGGFLLTQAFRRFLIPDNLHGVAALACTLLLFAISNWAAHESGLITVTVLGIWLTNQKHFDVEHIIELKENLRTLLIGCLFIVLGSRVNLADVWNLGWPGLLFLVALILVIRPVSAFLSLAGSPLNWREKAFVAGLAPRGIVAAAVSSVFALKLEQGSGLADISGADQLATITFLVIVGSVAVYGLAATPLAKALGLADDSAHGMIIAGADAWVRDFAGELHSLGIPVLLVDTNYNKISQARMSGLRGVCANVLNEHAREDLPLGGIGCLLAMTPNDEVNSLAVRMFRTQFDRKGLYQMTFKSMGDSSNRGMTRNLLGRELFRSGMTFTKFRDLHDAGAKFKATKLSDAFSYKDFLERYGDDPVLMCVLQDDRSLKINTVSDPLVPAAGQTIISLVSSVPLPRVGEETARQPTSATREIDSRDKMSTASDVSGDGNQELPS